MFELLPVPVSFVVVTAIVGAGDGAVLELVAGGLLLLESPKPVSCVHQNIRLTMVSGSSNAPNMTGEAD